VDVTDRGDGLSDEASIIFRAVLHHQARGLGLGLSISRAIVTAHGGTLDATRNAGTGMTFSAAFPCWRPLEPDQSPSGTAQLQERR
jgi:two-component system sensor kinase FixL